MSQFSSTPPPYVKNGKFLSAYFANQLSETVNAAGGAVFGANVARWIECSGDTLHEADNVYALIHIHDLLKITFGFGDTDMLFKVFLSTDDNVIGTKVYEATTTNPGPKTLTFDLSTSPNGFSVNYGQMYFVRIYSSESGESSAFWTIDNICEVGENTIVKPTLSDITTATVIGETYLNSLVDAARDVRLKLKPNIIPFVGFTLAGGTSRDGTFIRYKIRHVSRWLHYALKGAESGGGADGVKVYWNNALLANFNNNNSYYAGAWDTDSLPFGIASPTLGSEYEIKFQVERDTGVFQLFYLWELPYI